MRISDWSSDVCSSDLSVDFILPVFADHPFRDMHRKLAANCLAQASALMRGKSAVEVRIELQAKGLQGAELDTAIPHGVFLGDSPSNPCLIVRIRVVYGNGVDVVVDLWAGG